MLKTAACLHKSWAQRHQIKSIQTSFVFVILFQEIVSDQPNSDDSILTKVFTRENLSCNSMKMK